VKKCGRDDSFVGLRGLAGLAGLAQLAWLAGLADSEGLADLVE
jgi:hypothetical protein